MIRVNLRDFPFGLIKTYLLLQASFQGHMAYTTRISEILADSES